MTMNAVKQAETNRDVARPEPAYLAPSVDIFETKDEYVLEAEMPGVGKKGIEALLEGNELTIVGHRQVRGDGEVLHRESSDLDYRRTFVLDPMVDTSKLRCTIDQGLLRVHLPKAEKVKPRKIAVTD